MLAAWAFASELGSSLALGTVADWILWLSENKADNLRDRDGGVACAAHHDQPLQSLHSPSGRYASYPKRTA
jgi:hypothetical protein